MSWRKVTNWAKHSDRALRVADWLGRGRGGLRFLDHLHTLEKAPQTPDLSDWAERSLSAVWIGHATVLLRIGGITILTDPVFSTRVGLGMGLFTAGPQRLVAPAMRLRDLPPLDVILISHAHFDHLDRPTLRRLPKNVPVITSDKNYDLIHDLGFKRVTELPWGESTEVKGVKFTARQVRHWGARTFLDSHRGFSAFLIESAQHRVLYGGDTAYHDHFKDIGKVDLAIFGIGAYDPYIQAHATPEQAWAMANHVDADYILPMHHSTFQLSHEPLGEPMERLLAAAGTEADRITVREVGGQWASES